MSKAVRWRKRKHRAAKRSDLRIEAITCIQRFLGTAKGKVLSPDELAEAEKRLGLRVPDPEMPFSHIRGRILRVLWRMMDLRLMPDELSFSLARSMGSLIRTQKHLLLRHRRERVRLTSESLIRLGRGRKCACGSRPYLECRDWPRCVRV